MSGLEGNAPGHSWRVWRIDPWRSWRARSIGPDHYGSEGLGVRIPPSALSGRLNTLVTRRTRDTVERNVCCTRNTAARMDVRLDGDKEGAVKRPLQRRQRRPLLASSS